ncbi:cytochrome P450 6A70 precursor [Ceratitis capitata]|uniref:Putative cytochrome P450 6a14 n=3 Tax=Ceratitis capitata TaxID=7213 RepID=W8AY63_CERCA|nr:cytochrome P450 6A70 precursor [Ceratitis capitata]
MAYAVVCALLLVIAASTYMQLRRHFSYWARRGVPHEQPKLFIGNMSGIGTRYHWKEINERIYTQFRGQTPIIGAYIFLQRVAFIIDLDLIKRILVKDFNNFTDRGLFHNVRDDPLTGNLLFLDGEQWRVLRHKLSPAFTTGKLRYMFPTMVAVSERIAGTCERIMDLGSTVEMKELCARYTTDVIGEVAFGIECNSLRDPQAIFRRMGRNIVEKPRHSLLVQAFMFTDPKRARQLRLKNFPDDVTEFFMGAVRETVAYREENKVRRNDFMDMMLELKAQRDRLNGVDIREDDLTNGLNIDQVAAQALVFYLAGFETSSTVMSFCIYELALREDVQMKLREEIFNVLQKTKGELTYEAIKEMTYLKKVIAESLRMHPVIPHLVRVTTADYHIPNTDIVLERGMRLFIPVDAIHHDPEIYAEPEKFDPERFTPAAIEKRHPFAYLPFGEGPRNCIGMRFGELQASIGIIQLLRNFHFKPCARTKVPLVYAKKNFLIAAEGGIHLMVEKLEKTI